MNDYTQPHLTDFERSIDMLKRTVFRGALALLAMLALMCAGFALADGLSFPEGREAWWNDRIVIGDDVTVTFPWVPGAARYEIAVKDIDWAMTSPFFMEYLTPS